MADLIQQFASPTRGTDGTQYFARVYGEQQERRWVGWLEFVPIGADDSFRTAVETEQSNRESLASWAAGLESNYLQGALARARRA